MLYNDVVTLTVGCGRAALEGGGGGAAARLFKEGAGALQHQLQLDQLIVAACQALRIAVGLQQLALQLLQLALSQRKRQALNKADCQVE